MPSNSSSLDYGPVPRPAIGIVETLTNAPLSPWPLRARGAAGHAAPTPAKQQSRALRFAASRAEHLALATILAIGAGLRLYAFPRIPNGLNQDELSAAYESFSLLSRGTDRWGYQWPAYFLSWGSGQNVLQSYLEIPAVRIFGLSPLGVRIVPLLFGLATITLLYIYVRRLYGPRPALLATFVLAISPWHVMLSRWALESNLLPFFLLLGATWLEKALRPGGCRLRPLSLLPFALALYAYGISELVILPFLL